MKFSNFFSSIKKEIHPLFRVVIDRLFYVGILSYLMFYVIDSIHPGFVTVFFGIKIFFVMALVTSPLFFMFHKNSSITPPVKNIIPIKNHIFIFFIAVFSGFLVYFWLDELSKLRWIIGCVTILVVTFLSYFIFSDSDLSDL